MIALKIGGSIAGKYSENLIEDVKKHFEDGLVIVHGGGRVVDELSGRFGIEQRKYLSVSGFKTRVTDEETLELIKMVFAGKINKEIVSALLKHGLNAVGLSGVDGRLILAKRKEAIKVFDERGRKRIIHGDLSGRPVKVNVNLLKVLLSSGYIPVVAPIGVDEEGLILNLDGDRVAARIAGELRCERLVILTDVDGVMVDGKVVESIGMGGLEEYVRTVSGGMKRKLLACGEALSLGVREAIIASALRENPLEQALQHIRCTVIANE